MSAATRRFAMIFAVVLMIGLLSGCSGITRWIIKGVSPGTDNTDISRTLSYMAPSWIASDEAAKDEMYDVIDLFRNKYPGMEINLEFVAWEDIITRYPIAFQANESPDIVMINDIALRSNIMNNRFYPLDDLLDKALIDDFPEMFKITIGLDGKIYAYPNNTTDVRVLYYNKDIFKAAGIDMDAHPDLYPVTWDDLEVYAKQTNYILDSEQFGFGFIGARTVHTPMFFSIFVMQQGASICDDTGRATFDNYESIKAAKFLYNMIDPYKVSPEYVLNMDDQTLLKSFLDGRFAMILNGAWVYPRLKEETGFNFGICRIPRPWNGQYATISGFWAQCISSKTKQPDLACELMLELSNQNKTVEELFVEDEIPLRLSYLDEADKLGSPVIRVFADMVRNDAVPSLVTEYPLDLYDSLNIALQKIWSGAPAEETLFKAAKEYNDKFGKN